MLEITRLYDEDPSFCTMGCYEQGLIINFGPSVLKYLTVKDRYLVTQQENHKFLVAPSESDGTLLRRPSKNRYQLYRGRTYLSQHLSSFGTSRSTFEPVPDRANTILVSLAEDPRPLHTSPPVRSSETPRALTTQSLRELETQLKRPAVEIPATIDTQYITQTLERIAQIEKETPYRLRFDPQRGKWTFLDIIELP